MVACMLSSCSENDTVILPEGSPANINLKISPATRSDIPSAIETIKTLRIILLDKNGKVEVNELVTSEENLLSSYQWSHLTTIGMKTLFVIANEDSVEDAKIEGEEESAPEVSLKDRVEAFTPGMSGFEQFINSIYFFPDYSDENKPLPMTGKYYLDFEEEEQTFNVYLVFVATKFQINFKNYRNDIVVIDRISIDKIADSNYLMASLSSADSYVDGEYWIDWLHEVTKDTNRFPEINNSYNSNDFINGKWGWLRNYGMPSNTKHETIELLEATNSLNIDPGNFNESDPEPFELSLSPFYYPESKFIGGSDNNQKYTIAFVIRREGDDPVVLSKDLTNVKTLFRNTLVNINVEMNTAYEEIYVEIGKWNEDMPPAFGTISKQ